MSTITTMNSGDGISASRTVINTNFSNLNTDKFESSNVDTDTSLAANSDSKVPSQKAVKTYIDTQGGANASETVRGIVEEATDAEMTAGTATGGTGAKLFVTPAKLSTYLSSSKPIVRVYSTAATAVGSSTTRFDITNPSGTTFRYTYDGTGTDPSFSAVNYPVGQSIYFNAQNFSAGNNGVFVVINSGANFIEVTNASGVAENDKTIGSGSVWKGSTGWSKPSNLKFVIAELVGAGGGGGGCTSNGGGNGGAAGGYSKKVIAASSLNSTEAIVVGLKGVGVVNGTGGTGNATFFGSHLSATGGGGGSTGTSTNNGSTSVGVGSNGDINLSGGTGSVGYTANAAANTIGGTGGASFFGGGGSGGNATSGNSQVGANGTAPGSGGGGGASGTTGGTVAGGDGKDGYIIVTEYY